MAEPSSSSGYFYGERQELELRYAYRPEYVPLLLDYLGARGGMSILDVGCGSGFSSRLLAKALPDAQVIGFDSDARSLEIARRLQNLEGPQANLRFEQGDGHRFAFADNTFDLVTSHRLL